MVKNILKGAVIGIANIIPGVSGGTMAVAMGIYDTLIHALTHLFKEFKKSVMILVPILLGAAIGIVGLSFLIEKMFNWIPMQTNLLFIGLILGGLPAMIAKIKAEMDKPETVKVEMIKVEKVKAEKVKGETVKGETVKIEKTRGEKVKDGKIRPGHIIVCILFFAIVVGSAALGSVEGKSADLSMSFLNIVKLFGVGVIASATMVIPGVSGSMMLMLMGYYNPIIETVNNFIRSLIAFDMEGILAGFCVLCPAGIGVVLGIFLIAKIIEIIFEKFPLYAYWAIIGLIVASPFAIVLMGSFGTITVIHILTSAVTFAAGFMIAKKLGE